MQTNVSLYPRTEAEIVADKEDAARAAPFLSYDALTTAAESEIEFHAQNHPMCADAVYSFWNSLTAGQQTEADRERLKALVGLR